MKSRLGRFLATAVLLASPAIASAQASLLNFNIAAGAAFPTGDASDVLDVGYNLTVGVGMRPPLSPLGFRLEGTYNEWSVSDFDAKDHVGGVSANVIYDLTPVTAKVAGTSIYAIGGLGGYGMGDGGGTRLGWNIGGGVRLPLSGFSAYLEARFYQVRRNDDFAEFYYGYKNANFIPIVFGLIF